MSREYMPLDSAVHAFRCARPNFISAIHNMDIKAWRHPHTNRIWVHVEQAMQVAFYRTKRFIFRMLPKTEAETIIRTRPKKIIYIESWNMNYETYFVPELSHRGGKYTSYQDK